MEPSVWIVYWGEGETWDITSVHASSEGAEAARDDLKVSRVHGSNIFISREHLLP